MSSYVLPSASSSSGHVINWSTVPGLIVGYPNYPGASVLSLSYLTGCCQLPGLLARTSASAANGASRTRSSSSSSAQPPANGTDLWMTPVCGELKWMPKHKVKNHVTLELDGGEGKRLCGSQRVPDDERVRSLPRILDAGKTEDDGGADADGDGVQKEGRMHYCRICRMTFNAPSQAQQHYAGRHHARKARLCSRYSPPDDNRQSSSSSSSTSSLSYPSSSIAAVATTTIASPLSVSSNATTAVATDTPDADQEMETSSYDAACTSTVTPNQRTVMPNQRTVTPNQRTVTPNHQGSETGSGISASVYCRLCAVAFNSDKQALQHYSGKIHAKRLRAESVIYAYSKKGYVIPGTRKHASPASAAATASSASETIFSCVFCGLRLKSKRLLERHLRRHRRLADHRLPRLRFDSRVLLFTSL